MDSPWEPKILPTIEDDEIWEEEYEEEVEEDDDEWEDEQCYECGETSSPCICESE